MQPPSCPCPGFAPKISKRVDALSSNDRIQPVRGLLCLPSSFGTLGAATDHPELPKHSQSCATAARTRSFRVIVVSRCTQIPECCSKSPDKVHPESWSGI
jgi:hypothetical protein